MNRFNVLSGWGQSVHGKGVMSNQPWFIISDEILNTVPWSNVEFVDAGEAGKIKMKVFLKGTIGALVNTETNEVYDVWPVNDYNANKFTMNNVPTGD